MAEATKRDQFIQSVKEKLDRINGEIDLLEEKIKVSGGQAREKYQDQLEEVRAKRTELKQKLKDLKAASDAQWDKLKLEVEHAWKAFSNSVNYFKSHFK
jgi:DNA repair ATPase RecN